MTHDIPRTAIIGGGAIGQEILAQLGSADALDRVACVLERPRNLARTRELAAGRFPVTGELSELLAAKPQIVVECAGHSAVAAHGAAILAAGIDLIIAATGCLADPGLAARLVTASRDGGRLLIPSGAVAGIDGLLAARASLASVTYQSAKPPVAWRGTPAETLIDLSTVTAPTVFFEGSAREAALSYPQNANVGVTIALAGIGLDRTRVELVADPQLQDPLGIIEADGALGKFRFEILAYAAPGNPKTSRLTAYSLLLALRSGWAFSAADALAETGA
ncbi:MAG TPA: aspartate dehydrogenase [Alphaproteobacteria bacterium]|nr:aspartate dehydrogenase [Alphaproteobacteria bacterium]